MLYDRATEALQPKVRHNRRGIRTDDKMAISRTILDYVMQHREGVLTSDARDDDRWDAGGSIVKLGVREAICVPMQGRYGTVGIIYIDTYTSPGDLLRSSQQTKFNDEHLKLMIAIGHQAALAVEDTSYYSAMVHAERLAAIGQTIAGLSHHIKNILQGISGGSYLIEEGLRADQPDVVRKGWRIVERNQERISRLVLDMLTFSKDRDPDAQPANLNEVTAEAVELMQTRAGERGVQLHFQPADQLPILCFDAESIHHAILNVVTNAIDACEDSREPKVDVSVAYHAGEELATVRVEDNGRGIPAEDQARIFQLFESTKGNRGTGLGLSVSQKILREHGGNILVRSEPGQGSLFTLQFPAVFPSSDNETPAEATQALR
jgi:signal transduction histidine kinase